MNTLTNQLTTLKLSGVKTALLQRKRLAKHTYQ